VKNLFSTQPSLYLLLLTCSSKFLFISRAGLNFLSLALFFLVLLLSNCKKIYSQEPLTPVNQAITSLDKSLNQIDIVNISSPNANGVSHNLFVDYNVNPSGLILNNAIGQENAIVNTKLAGIINENPHLVKTGSASLIINEVISTNQSKLLGYTEISGKKADLIIANPNGIEINGTGFINVDKLTIVSGSYNSSLNDFNLKNSTNDQSVIKINGDGADFDNLKQTNLVANKIEINGLISAEKNNLNIFTGDKNYNHQTNQVFSNLATNADQVEVIDLATSGRIQAGKIFIVNSQENSLVNLYQDLIADQSIEINSQGEIIFTNLASVNGDIKISANNINQLGNIQTNGEFTNIDLKSNLQIINHGNIKGQNKILIDSKNQVINQNNSSNIEARDLKIITDQLINHGNILVDNNLEIFVKSLVNDNQIISKSSISLIGNELINNQSILAKNYLELNLTEKILNNKNIILSNFDDKNIINYQALSDQNNLLINTKKLENKQQIISDNNIKINAKNIDNNSQNSSISSSNNLEISFETLDNQQGLIKSNQIQLLLTNYINKDLSVHNPELVDQFLLNQNGLIQGIKDLKLNVRTIKDFNLTGKFQSEENIEIYADNLINQTNLYSNGDIKIELIGNLLNDKNENIYKIIAENLLQIITNNNIENYGIFQANQSLNLTSKNGDIINHQEAKIISGQSDNSLISTNNIINNSAIVSHGNLNISANNFFNYSRVDVAKDLQFFIDQDLINQTKNDNNKAMIYADKSINLFVANKLLNDSKSSIFSNYDLLIQKYPQDFITNLEEQNFTNSIENNSAQIISYLGKITIFAKDFSNQRSINPFNALLDPKNNGTIAVYNSTSLPDNFDKYDWQYNNQGCFGHRCQENYSGYYAKQLTNQNSISSSISSQNGFEFNGENFTNSASKIVSFGDIIINAKNFNNTAIDDPGLYAFLARLSGSDDHTYIFSLGKTIFYNYNPGNGSHTGSYQNPQDFIQSNPAILKSARNIIINAKSIENTDKKIDPIAKENPKLINGYDLENIITTSTLKINFENYFNLQNNLAIFEKINNPNRPLFETRSEFIDQAKFFASNYFYNRIGFDLEEMNKILNQSNQRLIGDQFFQNKILVDQLTNILQDQLLLSDSTSDSNIQIKQLIDNAVEEYNQQGLKVNQELNNNQISNLKKDIIWFEAKKIDGQDFIIPSIYFSKSTKENLAKSFTNKSTIFAKQDLKLNTNSDNVINHGSIVANNIEISSAQDIINNNFGNISAKNNLVLNASQSLKNFSKIEAQNNLSILANDVINSSVILTNDQKLLNNYANNQTAIAYLDNTNSSGNTVNLSSKIHQTASISSAQLLIDAKNNFINNSANISVNGDAKIIAGNQINFNNLQLNNSEISSFGRASKNNFKSISSTQNIANNLNIEGNLDMITTGINHNSKQNDINLNYTNLNVEKDLNLIAKDNINITSALDIYQKIEQASSKNFSKKTNSFSQHLTTYNKSSNLLVNGNVNISSGQDTNIIASNIIAKGTGNILVGSYLDQNQNQNIFNSKANLNIINGKNIDQFYANKTTTKLGLSIENFFMSAVMVGSLVALAPVGGALIASSSIAGGAIGSINKQKNSRNTFSYQEQIIKSNLEFQQGLNITSANNIFLQGSRLSINNQENNLTNNQLNKPDKTQNNQDQINQPKLTINAGNNLIINPAVQVSSKSYVNKEKNNYFAKIGVSGFNQISLVDSEIDFNNDFNNLNLNIANQVILNYNQNNFTENNLTNNLVNYLNNSSQSSIINPLNEISSNYHKTFRNLTPAGQAVVAITASAITTGLLNGFELIGSTASTTASSSSSSLSTSASFSTSSTATASANVSTNALTSLSSSAISTSTSLSSSLVSSSAISTTTNSILSTLNSNLLSQTALRLTTKQILSQALISGINQSFIASIASLSAFSSTSAINNQGRINQIAKDLSAKNTIEAVAISALSAGISSAMMTAIDPVKINPYISSIAQTSKRALLEVAVDSSASIIASQLILGNNFLDKFQDNLKSSLVNLGVKIASYQIGRAYHGSPSKLKDSNHQPLTNIDGTLLMTKSINQPTQLALHGLIGCLSSSILQGNCQSSALSSVAGELSAENFASHLNQDLAYKNVISKISGLYGFLSSMLYDNVNTENEIELVKNIYHNFKISQLIANNNALQMMGHPVLGHFNHMAIVHTPEANMQAYYVNRSDYVKDPKTGLMLKTWGAGPANDFLGFASVTNLFNDTLLIGGVNRSRDIDMSIKNYKSTNLVPINQEEKAVAILDYLAENYTKNLIINLPIYNILSSTKMIIGNNSNSYSFGLGRALAMNEINLPQIEIKILVEGWEYESYQPTQIIYKTNYKAPGFNKPIETRYFLNNQENLVENSYKMLTNNNVK
jgi:hypothetical protein